MLTVTITCLSFLNNLVTIQLSGWPGLSVGLREGSSGSGAFWRVRIPQVWVAEGELPVGVGGVSSGPTITTAPVIITPQRHLHHSNHPHPDMVTLRWVLPPCIPRGLSTRWGGVCAYPKSPRMGQRGCARASGGLHPLSHPGPLAVQGIVKLR